MENYYDAGKACVLFCWVLTSLKAIMALTNLKASIDLIF